MTPKLLRLAYMSEFLLALAAIFIAWPQIGGVAVLDLMPWSLKLLLGSALTVCVVGFTRAIVNSEKLVNGRSFLWLTGIAVLLVSIGVVTYYYMLEEESEESDEPSSTVTIHSPRVPASGTFL